MTILKDEEGYKNTFEITDSDVEDAQFAENILSEDGDRLDNRVIDQKTKNLIKK